MAIRKYVQVLYATNSFPFSMLTYTGNGKGNAYNFDHCIFGIYSDGMTNTIKGAVMTNVVHQGIFVKNSTMALKNIIEGNEITAVASSPQSFTQFGINLSNNNISFFNTRIKDNLITMTDNAFVRVSTAIRVLENLPFINNNAAISGNEITMSNALDATGIDVIVASSYSVMANDVNLSQNSTVSAFARGIRTIDAPNSWLENNSVDGQFAGNMNSNFIFGISSTRCNGITLICNCVNQTYEGIHFEGAGIATLQTSNIYNHNVGLNILANANIGPQPNKLTIPNTANQWLGSYGSGLGANWITTPLNASVSPIYYKFLEYFTPNNFGPNMWFRQNSGTEVPCANNGCK